MMSHKPSRPNPFKESPKGDEDCLGKLKFCTRVGATAAVVASIYDVVMFSRTKGYGPTLYRIVATSTPIVVPAASFAILGCAFTSIRGVDDNLNFGLAGGISAAMAGAMIRKPNVAILGGIVGYFLGRLYKDSVVNKWSWMGGKNDGNHLFDRTLLVYNQHPQEES